MDVQLFIAALGHLMLPVTLLMHANIRAAGILLNLVLELLSMI